MISKTNNELTICWSITSKCNMNCWYCFAQYDANGKPIDTSPAIIRTVLTKLEDISREKSLRLVILGGEPTLHPDINTICNRLLLFSRKVILVTNGTKIDTIQNLPSDISVDLSYHGQDIKQFTDTIKAIREHHFVQVLCVLDRYCLERCISVSDYCKEQGIPFEAIPMVDNKTEIADFYDDDILRKLSDNIVYTSPLFGRKTSLEIYRENRNFEYEQSRPYICNQRNIAIYPNGILYPCCHTGMINHRKYVDDDHAFRSEIICLYPFCMQNRGCLDFAGWRQDPDESSFDCHIDTKC